MQRRLTGLGFDTKVTGKFDEPTRAVITRWQAARGYPKSGFLNKLQHKALLTEIVATAPTASSDDVGRKAGRRPAPGSAAAAQCACRLSRGPRSRWRGLRRRRDRRHGGRHVPTLIVTSAPEIQKPGSPPGFFYALADPRRAISAHSACPSVSFTILSPPEVSRHISTSLPAGTGLAQVICGLLSYLVV